MPVTQDQLDTFHRFASEQVRSRGPQLNFEEIVDMWRLQHPEADEAHEDVLAVKASLRDMESGETGRPWDEFVRDFRVQNSVADDS